MLAVIRQRDFALLWSGGLIALTGGWVLGVALPFHIYQITGSALAAGMMAIAHTLPAVVSGSAAGVFVDRWDRKVTLVSTSCIQGLLLLALIGVRSAKWVWLVYLVAFLRSALSQFFSPAENALLPQLVKDERLVEANSLNALNNNLAMLIGPAIGGVLMARVGFVGVVLTNAAAFLISGAMISCISRSSQPHRTTGEVSGPGGEGGLRATWLSLVQEWLTGLRQVRESRVVAGVFSATGAAAMGSGIFSVLLIPFLEILGGGAQEFGWLLTIRGIGGLVGGLILAQVGGRIRSERLFPFSLLVAGALGLVMFNIPALPVALVVLFLWGTPAMGAQASSQALLQSRVSDEYRGRVFGAYAMTGALLSLLGQTLAGLLANHLGTTFMLNVDAALYSVAGVAALMLLSSGAKIPFR